MPSRELKNDGADADHEKTLGSSPDSFHETESAAGILPADRSEKSTAGKMPAAPSRCRCFSSRFRVPMHAQKRMEALHEPQSAAGILPADQSEQSTAGKMPAAPWPRRLTSWRFKVPMHGRQAEGALPEQDWWRAGPALLWGGSTAIESLARRRRVLQV